MKLNLLFVILLILGAWNLKAQDIHLSHVHASPTLLNPAMTGLFDGDMRFIANARSQWNDVTNGYKTVIGSMDMKLKGFGSRDFLSGGLQLYSDRAGDLNFSTKSAGFAMSYLRALDRRGRSFISFGVQNSLVNNSVDYTKIEAFEQIAALSSESLRSNINYWDMSAGIGWFQRIDRYNSFYLGASAFHLNKPIVSFDNRDDADRQHILYRKLTVHGGASLKLADGFDIKPNFIFVDQGPHKEITMGSFARFKTYHNTPRKPLYYVYFGAWLRWHVENDLAGADAIVASVRFDYETWHVAFSYDVNISQWTAASRGKGGPEVSIVKVIKMEKNYRKATKVKCPIM